MRTVELVVPARRDYLALVRLVTTAAAALEPALPDARLDDLRLAVSEACANAIDAHGDPPDGTPVVIRCEIGADDVTISVEDRGGGFDPDELVALPAAADPNRLRHEHGLGVPLMRSLTDEVTFERRGDGTLVRLTIRRDAR